MTTAAVIWNTWTPAGISGPLVLALILLVALTLAPVIGAEILDRKRGR